MIKKINLFILFIIIGVSFSYIVLPFKSNLENLINKNTQNQISDPFSILDNNLLYSNINCGNPQKEIEIYLSMEYFLFFIGRGFCINNNKLNSNYDPAYSSSFINNTKSSFSSGYIKNAFFSKEKIYFYINANLTQDISSDKIDLLVGHPGNVNQLFSNDNYCGYMGVQLYHDSTYHQGYSILNMLKQYNLTNNSKYTFIFNNNKKILNNIYFNNYEGGLIFGIDDNDYELFFKKNSNFTTINSGIIDVYKTNWNIIFNKISYKYDKKDYSYDISRKKVKILIDYEYFIISKEFFTGLQDVFFKNYLEQNICSIKKYEKTNDIILNYIICDKNKFKDKIKTFPTIYFTHIELNKIFELNYNDLFKEIGENIIFNAFYDENNTGTWMFGRTFLQKYQFIFDPSGKTLTFVDNNYSENGNNGSNFFIDNIWKIICILFLIVGIIFGLLMGKKLWEKGSKKRANELNDDYDYVAENKQEVINE